MRAQSTRRAHSTSGNKLRGALVDRTCNGGEESRIDDTADDALPVHHTTVVREFRRMPARHARLATVLLVAIGLLASAILLGRYLALETSPWPRTLDPCSALFSVSCDPALSDERFRILGVPIVGWGVFYSSPVAEGGPSFTGGHPVPAAADPPPWKR